MPKNLGAIDVKPKNFGVIDVKSKNQSVLDVKSKMNTFNPEAVRSYSVVINAGQWTGFLLSLTYPTTGTVVQWSEIG